MQCIYIIQKNAEGTLAEAAEILSDTIKFIILTSDENLFSIIFTLHVVRALCPE